MKRLLWIGFSIVLFFSGIHAVKADTILVPTSNKNGNVEIKLKFEEGYVGAIDLTLKVSSNIKVTNVIWNTTFPSIYTKRYTYDETNHIVKIYLATGNNTRNLVDKNGTLILGSLIVKSINGKSVDYTIDIESLSYVDANYTSIIKKDLKLSGVNRFTYQVQNDNTPTDVEKPSINKPNQSKPNQNTPKDDLEQDPTEEKPNTEEPSDKKDENDDEKDDDHKVDIDKKPEDDKQPENQEESKVRKSFDWKMMFGIVVIAILLITLISMITRKLKD